MDLERFTPADAPESVAACHEIYLSGIPADDPAGPLMSAGFFGGWLKCGSTEDPSETWLARDSGKACGWYVLTLPERENRHLAEVKLTVHAASRRAGLGTALARHAAARARHFGRTRLEGLAREGTPSEAFARALGARLGMAEVRRVLDLTAVPAGHLAGLRAKAESAASGYRLLSWDGPAPGDQQAGVAAINDVAEADIPREAGLEPQRWDAERVRLDERRRAAQGLRSYSVAARSLATGEMTGLTQLVVDPAQPTWGFQELTAVARAHRGHRLGLLVKLAMLELLAEREPLLTRIITGNSDANEHMIAINTELGFAVLDQWPGWGIEVDQLLT
jgi:GNAT superfamily N-acetyltransferase/RimJ/RimL family protein N-acetyltransferase